MSINRGVDKEDVVCKYNGLLLSHKKEWNNAICSNMHRPTDCHTEWSKSDRKGEISYDISYMWNLKTMVKWTYLQNRNTVSDIQQTYGYQVGKGKREKLDWDWYIYNTIDKRDS